MMTTGGQLALGEGLDEPQPVEPRHADVGEHHVEALVGEERERLLAVARP